MRSLIPRLKKPGASHPHLKRTKMSVMGHSAFGHHGAPGAAAFPGTIGSADGAAASPAFPMAPQGGDVSGPPSPAAPPMVEGPQGG